MTDRALVLGLVALVGLIFLGFLNWYRARMVGGPERLDVEDFGLELMEGCCAFIVFTSETCRPCKAAIRIVRAAADRTSGLTEVRLVDAIERADIATRYGVRSIPTVFLITASGHVVRRWASVPAAEDVTRTLETV
ncbi:MAG: thioredoxin domain-containing protein [Actinomycetota bacterium]